MYTSINFRTKKELKEAIKSGRTVSVYQPNDIFQQTIRVGHGKHTVHVEGPHYPEPHRWYATCECINGYVVKVR